MENRCRVCLHRHWGSRTTMSFFFSLFFKHSKNPVIATSSSEDSSLVALMQRLASQRLLSTMWMPSSEACRMVRMGKTAPCILALRHWRQWIIFCPLVNTPDTGHWAFLLPLTFLCCVEVCFFRHVTRRDPDDMSSCSNEVFWTAWDNDLDGVLSSSIALTFSLCKLLWQVYFSHL